MYKKLGIAAFIILLLTLQAVALDVSDTLSGGSWTLADSPVRVVGDIVLPDGNRLTIDPGVLIDFTGPYNFVINGLLQAVGTRTDSIVFTSEFRVEHPDSISKRWKGLRFENADRGCKLTFCIVEFSYARGNWPENCGGGVYVNGSSPEIRRCSIRYNKADGDGGGIYAMFTTSIVRNNLIYGNFSGNFGGGIFITYSEPKIINCTIAKDSALGWGGGIFVGTEGEPNITNCIISHNFQDLWDGDLPSGDQFFNNLARIRSAEPKIVFSCIPHPADKFPGTGNINSDPEFRSVDLDELDFQLKYSSSCIDAGDPEMNPSAEPDILVNRINIGAYGGTEDAALSVPVIFNDFSDIGITLSFGSIRCTTQTSREIKIENNGHYNLFLYDFRFETSVFFPDSVFDEVKKIMVPEFTTEPIEPEGVGKFNINFLPLELDTIMDTLTIISNDTLHPLIRLPLMGIGIYPKAFIEDTLLDFGGKQIDVRHRDTLYVHNQGSSNLRVSSVSIQGDNYTASVDDNDVDDGDSTAIIVIFLPTHPEKYEANLTIRTNDRDLLIPLEGTGTGPKMIIEIDSLFMGYAYAADDGDTVTYSINISNIGSEELVVTEANVADVAFSVNLPDNGLRIAVRDTMELPINFHPLNPNEDYQDLLFILSNYPLPDTVELYGTGMAEPGAYVFGDVGGATWDWADDHPDYIILDSVYVPAHAPLRIMPGARILFEPNAFMRIDGELRAIGLPDDSIRFIPRDQSGEYSARWGGIHLSYEDATRMAYCLIQGSREGVHIREASPLIQFCTITDNIDTSQTSDGGGFHIENSGARIAGCIVKNNRAQNGGGIFILNSKPVINNCIIRNNAAINGGGVYMKFLVGALFQSNLIYGNTGGAVSIHDHSAPRLINNTIANNMDGGITATIRSVPVLMNTILWNNGGDTEIKLYQQSNTLVSYCGIEGNFDGTHNLNLNHNDMNPQFADADAGDYRLLTGSPLIDTGNPERIYRDLFFPPSMGVNRCDIGAYGGPFSGSWTIPDVSISLFQNPAFPQWIDIFVTSLGEFQEAPVCSVEFSDIPAFSIQLNQNPSDDCTYMGSYEASTDGSLFITVSAVMSGGRNQKVSRSYELTLIEPGGGTIRMVGVIGEMTLPSESYDNNLVVLSGCDPDPIKPSNGKIFLSPLFFIRGLDVSLLDFGKLSLEFEGNNWLDSDLDQLGIYRLENGVWIRLKGGYDNGYITGLLDRGGCFAIALDEHYSASLEDNVPRTAGLIKAYPNPFNRKVTIMFDIIRTSTVQLSVYNLAGRQVANLVNSTLSPGSHTAVWDGRMDDGSWLPSGIYWGRLDSDEEMRLVKLLLLR
ncbi:MAG: right-handed parallel beta-helix repeat-containing protein [Candidatus Hatepunaea meridiana]|nr:right-handed parallel beta-helix repeat-containing protein [Candidatus Hatepunaea meridiana]